MLNQERCRLYLITPPQFEVGVFARQFRQACDGGDIAALQLRMKPASQDEIRRAGEVLLPLCQEHDVAFIINDHPELAREIGADGVHIGEPEDGTVAEARAIVGEGKVVGYSCYASRDRAFEAAEQGADYVAFGQFYPSTTKPPKGRPTPELLEWWGTHTTLPSVAIGGITPDNAVPLVNAGADFLAVITAVWEHPKGPKVGVQEFNALMAKE